MSRTSPIFRRFACSGLWFSLAAAPACGDDPAAGGGIDGKDGADGQPGADGQDGAPGDPGQDGRPGADGLDIDRAPRSAVVALSLVDDLGTGAGDLVEFVEILTDQYARGTLSPALQFPLAPASTDGVRAIAGLRAEVLVSWLDPLGYEDTAEAPRFGANNDFIAYFGDGWDAKPGDAPQWHGSGSSAWLWVNHEYVSGDSPTATTAPTSQHLTLARFLRRYGVLGTDPAGDLWDDASLVAHVGAYKRQLGGSWLHVVQDPASGSWSVDYGRDAIRYDATSATLTRITGIAGVSADRDDEGADLPPGVAAGIMADCSGAQTPWGTVISAEENVQDYYGDLETCWAGQQFVAGAGCDPGQPIALERAASDASEFGRSPDPNARHARDLYGYLVEVDPGQPPDEYLGKSSPGVGHQKLGGLGRARWENAAFAVDGAWRPLPNQPIVMYGGDDRRSGRIFKWVSKGAYKPGMARAQIRQLLAEGSLYVAHFEGLDNATGTTLAGGKQATEGAPGEGRWIRLSVDNTSDVAPNAGTAAGPAATKVGAALKDMQWNGIGGFASDDDVRRALFTACNKLGIMELNRPEDIEWNPHDPSGTPRLYVAFTKHGGQTALDADGVMFAPDVWPMQAPKREDAVGTIFAIEESDPAAPATSASFSFFKAFQGTAGDGVFDVADPDNLMIDAGGGVWFGTDGNFGVNRHADALYYLDLDPQHRPGVPGVVAPTWGRAFRVVAGPSDSEATGPALSSDMRTLFFSVQHPGEDQFSSWPANP